MTENITVLQWNIRSLSRNIADLIFILSKCEADVILLSETWLKPNQIFSLPGYNLFRSDRRDKNGGGTAIAVHTHLSAVQLPTPSSVPIESTGVQVTWGQETITFLSVYLAPNQPLTIPELSVVCSMGSGWRFIGGDLNTHHSVWSSHSTRRGDDLLQVLDDFGMLILNDGSPTRLTPPSAQISAVDITATNNSKALHVENRHFTVWQ